MEDKELVKKISAKDQAAFKFLVEKYQNMVINTCYRLVGNFHDAEDVAQEVFFQVYKRAEKFRGAAKLSTWIYRIAVNRSLNFKRDQKRHKWLNSMTSIFDNKQGEVEKIPAGENDQPDLSFEAKEQTNLLQSAINSLPEKQRVAFMLNKYEGLSYKEIAPIMQKSISSVESLIHRAKLNLQRRLIKVLK